MKELYDKLFNQEEENLLLLVNGQGGIGKTTLASKYYHQYQNQYSHLAWALAEPSILDAVLRLANPLGLDFPPTMEKEQKLEILLSKMQNLEKPSLLILDNVDKIEDLEKYYPYLRKCSNFHLLLTSRITDFENAQSYAVKGLKEKDALELFKKYYKAHKTKEDDLVLKIFEAVGENTLVIEILAKNLNNINNKLKTHYSLENLLNDIEEKGLLSIQNHQEKGVKVDWHTWEIEKTKPENIILAMYDLSNLEENEIILLSNFAVLPPENIPFEILEELLENLSTKSNQQSTPLDETLLSLAQKGFLDYNEEKASFKVSPVIQEITKTKNKTRLSQDCQALLDKLYFLFETDNGYLKNIKHNQAPQYYPFAQGVFLNMPEKSYTLGWTGIYLGDYENSIGNLQKAREYFQKAKDIFQAIGDEHSFGACLERLGNSYRDTGNLQKALAFYEEGKDLNLKKFKENPDNSTYKNSLAISYEKLGSTQSSLGNLEEALKFFEEDIKLSKELYQDFPANVEFKNGLAISYEKLGSTQSSLGNLEEALKFFEEYNRLEKELYQDFPNTVGFKNGLAISYSKLGSTQSSLGNLEEALKFFEEMNKLFEELYQKFPSNVGFKNGLAISYEYLGETHSKLGNLEEALKFFEEDIKLSKELYQDFPNNVGFKNGLAISYEKLGETHSSLGNLEEALKFFEEETELFEELHQEFPSNVEFKNGLAISYSKLGTIYEKIDQTKVKSYFLECKKLWIELANDFPAYVEFQNNLQWVESKLKALE